MIASIIIGIIAGFLAGKLMQGKSFGWLLNMFLGLFGGVLGGWLFEVLNIQRGGLLGQIGTATIGAVIILYAASMLKK